MIAFLGPPLVSRDGLSIDRVRRFEGEWSTAPFPPSEEFPLGSDPLGRDIGTVLVYGASQTLSIAAAVALSRLFLGMVLGTMAGWYRNRLPDRGVMSLVGYLAPFPQLILAMGLIFALGIRRGQSTFIIALTLVGWTEIAQYIRSEVMVIKQRPFIEGARAVGLGDLSVLTRHVLPIILPSLLALASLEMASALLILAELAFVGVFVGGGISLESLDALGVLSTYDDPEWGALLGSSWRYLRTATWVPFFPSAAFFTAILGFNLLGMGLQAFFERTRVNVASLSLGRFAVAVALLFLAVRSVLASTGSEVGLAGQAAHFSAERAMEDIAFLASPAREGRLVGTPGSREAAAYVEDQFRAAGLQRISLREGEGYIQRYPRKRVDPVGRPELVVLGPSGQASARLAYREDFAEKGYSGGGEAEGELVVVDFWRPAPFGTQRPVPMGLDATGKVLLIVSEDITLWPAEMRSAIEPAAILTVVPDGYSLDKKRPSLFHESEPFNDIPDRQWTGPWFNITESAADRLLMPAGQTVAQLREALNGAASPVFETSVRVRLRHPIETLPEIEATNVIGVLPGIDFDLSQEYVVLAAHYSGPGTDPDGTVYPAANDNASGVAILLEVARTWQEIGFEPRRTVAFVAWDERGSRYYASHPTSAFRPGQVLAVIQLQALGSGGPPISINREANQALIQTAQSAADRLGVPTTLSSRFVTPYFRPQDYPLLVLTRAGTVETSLTPSDTPEGIDPQQLSEAGQLAALLAMILSTQ